MKRLLLCPLPAAALAGEFRTAGEAADGYLRASLVWGD